MPRKKKPLPVSKATPVKKSVQQPPLQSKPADWVDKQDIIQWLHLSDGTLQKMRNDNEIEWSTIRGKIYYNQASFVELLEKNKRR